MLSENCRKTVFKEIDNFKRYVDTVFDKKKIFNIQNFANKNNNYIYEVSILDDIMATGSTGLEEIKTYDETFVMKEENGKIKLSIKGYIGNEKVDKMYEDDNLKIMIDEVEINYETVTYKMKVRNKIDDIIVLEDGSEKYEIVLDTNRTI